MFFDLENNSMYLARGLLLGQLAAKLRAARLHAVHLFRQPLHAGVGVLQGCRPGGRRGRHVPRARRRLHHALHAAQG